MRERPRTIQRLYEEFEKYCRSDNDLGCAWKSNLSKRSPQKLTNLARGNGLIPETPHTPTLETFLASTAKTPRKIPTHRLTPKAWSLARLVHHIRIKAAAAEAEEAVAGEEVAAGAEAITKKENGTASSIRRTTIIARITVQTRKDSRLSMKRRGRRRRELVP
jgi:hypothetical protein